MDQEIRDIIDAPIEKEMEERKVINWNLIIITLALFTGIILGSYFTASNQEGLTIPQEEALFACHNIWNYQLSLTTGRVEQVVIPSMNASLVNGSLSCSISQEEGLQINEYLGSIRQGEIQK